MLAEGNKEHQMGRAALGFSSRPKRPTYGLYRSSRPGLANSLPATYIDRKLIGLTGKEYTFDQLGAMNVMKIFSKCFNITQFLLKSVGLIINTDFNYTRIKNSDYSLF